MTRMVSIVSPFYNEQNILAKAIDHMVNNLERLTEMWEFIVVNDGSLDNSLQIAIEKSANDSRIKVVSYEKNQGRGYALKKGIDAAQGDIIITTEIDSSWGDDVVISLTNALRQDPTLDIVIASTHLSQIGYVNVPPKRVFLSKSANFFLGLTLSKNISMFTGMTRGYRAATIKHLPVSEKGKEFHLDVLAKAIAFGLKISEIPAVITWRDEKLLTAAAPKRKSSTKILKIIRSHLLFGLSGKPYRYLFVASLMMFLLAILFLGWGVINLITGSISIYLLTLSFSSLILTVLLGGIGILALQQHTILRELWITRTEVQTLLNPKN